MTVLSAVSLGLAVVLTVAGPALLRGVARWCGPSARTLLALWVLAPVGWGLAWVGAGLGVVAELWGPGVKGVVTACLDLAQALHRGEAGWVGLGVVVCGAAVGGRLLWVVARRFRREVRWRRRQRRTLAACARSETVRRQRVWVVESPTPDAYCVPGGGLGVVVTRGAVEALTPRQMDAVLAHEWAHLRGRHHLLVSWVRLLCEAFPGVPLLRAAVEEVTELVEWAADDYAVRRVGVGPLAHAVGTMAGPGPVRHGPAVLAASGASPVRRVRRLVGPAGAVGRTRRTVCAGVLAAVVALPVLAVSVTAAGVAAAQCACAL
ncbi:MAG TPA: M56 family metallopeptidase [Thermobifida alba]|nr:M56 family metallopeptidase [Thermobifida alba]